jgi:hypothetical protein
MTYVPVFIKAILPKVSKVDKIFGLWPKKEQTLFSSKSVMP